ncbi:hypothetical protein DFQ11_1011035 [Winogradskyella epiphytica]|uniref:Uncharacterized protein n=1 Tax=Winogradskyella epiphytica TaxID=262005 RepID=A0A2V4XXS8_9FLAO|nr:hypothetical protein [Winogradskyella epiphytica]PYE83597.1 hypothetical protein DFQ11_1011035 [Winogradskyella epiphytica]GGW59292.1 hypothetical protein GCM10008085_08890 [Winogradskyella epiphytica]
MKKSLIIILFLTLSLGAYAQEEVVNANDTELNETTTSEKLELEPVRISAEVKAKILRMNRKKSNEIISIKAYRKSLQIKVKTTKLC